MTGRKKNSIWNYFSEVTEKNEKSSYKRVKCNNCSKELSGLVARMKEHMKKCTELSSSADDIDVDLDVDPDTTLVDRRSKSSAAHTSTYSGAEPVRKKSKLDHFIIKTTVFEKEKLDIQIARFLFATNTPFNHVAHPEFIKLIRLLRPGYKPPNRDQVSNELLNAVYQSEIQAITQNLQNKTVCMSLDGWSNVHNDPIVCVAVIDVLEEQTNICESIDTQENSHTYDYMLSLAIRGIKRCQEHNCQVRSFVTDNAANLVKMRQELAKIDEIGFPDIITYGCSAHILNLLAHDIEVFGIKEHIKYVFKYFRNSHFAGALYKKAGGKSLVMPQDVRWNTLADCIESFLKNWPILQSICTEHRAAIDENVTKKVNDLNLKNNANDFLKRLKVIAVALDRIQKDSCTISEATEIWIEVLEKFTDETEYPDEVRVATKKRFKMAITAPHCLANILDHRFRGDKLTSEQINEGLDYAHTYHPETVPTIMSYQAKTKPFNGQYLFSLVTVTNVSPITWWRRLESTIGIDQNTFALCMQLHTAAASSASIERLFSAYGLVQSKLRNRLGNEKAAKLVTVFKSLNQKLKNHTED